MIIVFYKLNHCNELNRAMYVFRLRRLTYNSKLEEIRLAWCHFTCIIPCPALPPRLFIALRLETDKAKGVATLARHVLALFFVADQCAALDTAAYSGN